MATWTIPSATVNAEGNTVSLLVQVVELDTLMPNAPKPSDITLDPTKLFEIKGWRYDLQTGKIRLELPSTPKQLEMSDRGMEAGDVKFEIDPFGTDQNRLTFKVAIHLRETGFVAINAAASTVQQPKISRLEGGDSMTPGWVSVAIPGAGTLWPMTDLENVDLVTSLVGGIPTGDLKLRTDVLAESIAQDGDPANPLTWTDLSAEDNDLVGATDTSAALSEVPTPSPDQGRPDITFNGTDDRLEDGTPPLITANATIAVEFTPDPAFTTAGDYHLIGRYREGSRSWQVFFKYVTAADRQVVYRSRIGGGLHVDLPFSLLTQDTTVAFLLRRGDGGSTDWSAWINGRPALSGGSINASVPDGSNSLSAGARLINSTTWGDFYKGEMGQVVLYSNERPPFNLALILHQMAVASGVVLGTPLTPENYTEPQYLKPGAAIKLDRKPIARINCYGARYDENIFGQNTNWRPDPMNQGAVEHWLRLEIRDILNACDDYEIMFNRLGGTYFNDIVPTYIWGEYVDPGIADSIPLVTDEQWAALYNIFEEFDLDDHNNRGVVRPEPAQPFARRAWFYTGGGLPLKESGSTIGDLEIDGHMYNRVVGPLTGSSYRTILDNWTDKDARYRCLHCDATIDFYGLFTRLCNDEEIYEEFLLVGEAIPQDDEGRKGAVWYGSLEFPRAPWWNIEEATGRFSRAEGYNTRWSTEWKTRPIYFGIEASEYPYLGLPRPTPETDAGDGANMTIGDIYRFILKGATPVAVSPQARRKVGAAWNIAMKRVPMNAWDRTGRSCAVQR